MRLNLCLFFALYGLYDYTIAFNGFFYARYSVNGVLRSPSSLLRSRSALLMTKDEGQVNAIPDCNRRLVVVSDLIKRNMESTEVNVNDLTQGIKDLEQETS